MTEDSKNLDTQVGNINELTYVEASAELEEIIAELDNGFVDIDSLAVKFERAVTIIEELDRRIKKTKEKVDKLSPRLQEVRLDDAQEEI